MIKIILKNLLIKIQKDNGLKDISNISGIDNKINMEQNEQEDMTLKEIIQDKLLDIVDKK